MSKHLDLNLKQQLIEATDAVRKKFNSIKSNRMEDHTNLNKFYEPIITPLKTLAATSEKVNNNVPNIIKPQPKKSKFQYSTPNESIPNSERRNIFPMKTIENISSDESNNETSQIIDDSTFMNTPPSSSNNKSTFSDIEEYVNSRGDPIKKHLTNLSFNNPKYDTVFGVRYDKSTDRYYIGKYEVVFDDGQIKLYSNNKKIKSFRGTPQLYNMLFLKNPAVSHDKDDIKTFADIINVTNAAYVNYDLRRGFNIKNTNKYKLISQTLIRSPTILRKIGKYDGGNIGLTVPENKILNGRNVDYVYWNSVSELIQSLQLLWSSKMAGNTGHDNEILSIIEELREEGIIY